MTLLLLLAGLAVAGLGCWMTQRWRVLGQTLQCLGGLGLIAVIFLQVRQNVFRPQPAAPNRYKMAVSYALANSLLADVAGQSGKVVLLFPQRSVMDADSEASYENGFTPPLRHGHVTLDLKAVLLDGPNGDLSAFKQALGQAQDAMAVISYAGVPAGFENLFPAGQPEKPFFYVFDGDGTINWLDSLKAGRIRAVVVPQPGVDARNGKGMTGMPQTIFDQFFLLATPANADEVAASLKTVSKTQR
jgi:hypothetical protein